MNDKIKVRLYWLNGRVEELKGQIDAETTIVVRQTPDGPRHFSSVEEIDDEGFAIFWEDGDEPEDNSPARPRQ
jgi:hypothetical protein